MKIKIFKTNCHIDVKSVEDDINEFLTKISEKDVININVEAGPYGFDGFVVYKDNKLTNYKANIKVV
jgi:hypothetical protein